MAGKNRRDREFKTSLARRNREQRERDELAPSYIKKLLVGGTLLRFSDLPEDLIKLKTGHLNIARILRERKRDSDD